MSSSKTDLSKLYDAFGIGRNVRTLDVLLANIENAQRRSECLSAVERKFFTRVAIDEDGEEFDECPLSWGAGPTEYVEQFGQALAAFGPSDETDDLRAAALRDLAYRDGAQQALVIAHQSLQAADQWLAKLWEQSREARAALKANECQHNRMGAQCTLRWLHRTVSGNDVYRCTGCPDTFEFAGSIAEKTGVRIPWGAIDLDGKWVPNWGISFSPDDQRRENVAQGVICECGYVPSKCRCAVPRTGGV